MLFGNGVVFKIMHDTNPSSQKQAIEETKAVFAPLRERLDAAVEKVEGMLVGFSSLFFFWL